MAGSSRPLWITVALLGGGVLLYLAELGDVRPPPRAAPAARPPHAGHAAAAGPQPASGQDSGFSPAARWRRRQIFAEVHGDEAFERLGRPRPGEWLWSFKERGQTLVDYARIRFNRPTARRRVLQIQPYGDLTRRQRALLPILREYVSLFFGVAVDVLPPRALDRAWWSGPRRQYDAERIAAHLAERVPDDSLGVIGVTGSDLYALGLDFVFGVGLFQRRAGIYSLHRFGGDPRALLRRTLQLATHEIGHMFSLQHCVFYKCLLDGTNSLAESDREPLHLCPVCLAKLHHNLRFDPVQRYQQLARFYRRHDLVEQAAFAAARALELGAPDARRPAGGDDGPVKASAGRARQNR